MLINYSVYFTIILNFHDYWRLNAKLDGLIYFVYKRLPTLSERIFKIKDKLIWAKYHYMNFSFFIIYIILNKYILIFLHTLSNIYHYFSVYSINNHPNITIIVSKAFLSKRLAKKIIYLLVLASFLKDFSKFYFYTSKLLNC